MRALLLAAVTSTALLAGCEGCNKGGGASGADAAEDAAPVVAGGLTVVEGGTTRPDGGTLNATPVPTASVAAMVNPDKLPEYSGPTGIVEGTIRVTGDPAPVVTSDFSRCPDAEKTWGHAFRDGPPGPGGARPLADAIVVVTGYKGYYLPETKESAQIQIDDCSYSTRTLTLTYGERIEVKNNSNDFWTPVLEPGSTMVLMMATPHGDPTKIYPKKPGHYLLVDRDRKYAQVDVYAFLHPLHTASSTSGRYRIEGVPVGKLKVSTMHPRIDATAEQEVTVTAGAVTKVDLVLKNVNKDASVPAEPVDAAAAPPLR